MVFNGYGVRGNDILGMGNKPGNEPYETLVYATGPGFNYHLSNDTKEMFKPIQSFTDEQRSELTYMSSSLIQVSVSIFKLLEPGVESFLKTSTYFKKNDF